MKKNKGFLVILTLVLILSCIISKPSYGAEIGKDKKTVYLTFDDGASPALTNEIIKILEKNNIKATFFVEGNNARTNSGVIKKINESGMSIIPHIDTHEYNKIYSSANSYFDDLKNCENTILSLTGKSNSKFIRIPGGSDNTIDSPNVLAEIKSNIINSNKYYIDWTVDTQTTQTNIDFIESHIRECGGLYKVEVVLMHDLQNKVATVKSLQNTIDFYNEKGYEFKNLDNIEECEINYLKDIRVINKK
ncbi:polysaccharide deacetylase family protein [Clostridium gasigenes]|uniref:polysaccharide deacetylase family protein n=1 Tax=Clostridium gasigenes TaxID=94869 RepID=UPI001C0BBE79|nr:polysaccharide deacetylase family protein [Clostridium gasigenes]MBU3134743.1 polysaccharide deacetylase family protein [Clostridium gasigenes]